MLHMVKIAQFLFHFECLFAVTRSIAHASAIAQITPREFFRISDCFVRIERNREAERLALRQTRPPPGRRQSVHGPVNHVAPVSRPGPITRRRATIAATAQNILPTSLRGAPLTHKGRRPSGVSSQQIVQHSSDDDDDGQIHTDQVAGSSGISNDRHTEPSGKQMDIGF